MKKIPKNERRKNTRLFTTMFTHTQTEEIRTPVTCSMLRTVFMMTMMMIDMIVIDADDDDDDD